MRILASLHISKEWERFYPKEEKKEEQQENGKEHEMMETRKFSSVGKFLLLELGGEGLDPHSALCLTGRCISDGAASIPPLGA